MPMIIMANKLKRKTVLFIKFPARDLTMLVFCDALNSFVICLVNNLAVGRIPYFAVQVSSAMLGVNIFTSAWPYSVLFE